MMMVSQDRSTLSTKIDFYSTRSISLLLVTHKLWVIAEQRFSENKQPNCFLNWSSIELISFRFSNDSRPILNRAPLYAHKVTAVTALINLWTSNVRCEMSKNFDQKTFFWVKGLPKMPKTDGKASDGLLLINLSGFNTIWLYGRSSNYLHWQFGRTNEDDRRSLTLTN